MVEISRRGLIGATAGAFAVGAVGTYPVAYSLGVQSALRSVGGTALPFRGEHQSGITDALQERAYLATFAVTSTDATALRDMLAEWSRAAERMTQGHGAGPIGAVDGIPEAPPDDTGETLDLPPSNLTVTIGYGDSLFDGRFGLAAHRPSGLVPMPTFAKDQPVPEYVGGDILLQICADDDQVAYHALRNLIRVAKGTATPLWIRAGFSGAPSNRASTETPRNLLGFKDGTANLATTDSAETSSHLWSVDSPTWMAGGTYAAVRLFRFDIETWDRAALGEQEMVFGRTKGTGAPLSGGDERTTADFAARTSTGDRAIAPDSHMALAHPDRNNGHKILRRAYNYTNGVDAIGRLDAGLLFVSFQRSLTDQFVPMQNAMAASDRMNDYVQNFGGGFFAVPRGLAAGEDWGRQLLGA
ncbi:deferrochelatase/peroxidase EfeB [Microbacteriaceae bacterium MWH-Ta3]|nr:deferrochelatase/peroxidase EfeB [Microbacteriaceae bacterium MWH-Ta3]